MSLVNSHEISGNTGLLGGPAAGSLVLCREGAGFFWRVN